MGGVFKSVLPTKAIERGEPRQNSPRFLNRLENGAIAVIHSYLYSWCREVSAGACRAAPVDLPSAAAVEGRGGETNAHHEPVNTDHFA